MNSIHLIGAEDVRRAGGSMLEAANNMQRAASHIDDSMARHQRFMEDWLMRFENALEKINDIHTRG